MKRLPIGESDFKSIRNNGLLYVDKTAHLHQLISSGKFYFLSRPRRFGKSLLVKTLSALFSGEKELFKGLWIYDKIDWKKYPVISLSFNNIDYREKGLEKALCIRLDIIAEQHQIKLKADTAKTKFGELILFLGKKGRVVVLIDEYDKPILDYLHDFPQADINRDILKNFFGTLKGLEIVEHLQFVFLTGVSKFTRVSVFSELNNLTDLTAHPKYTTMLGITQEELESYFAPYLEEFTQNNKITKSELLKKIKEWYNGYTWDAKNFVYNPHSLLHLFHTGEFKNYWFQSGTTSWLIKSLRQHRIKLNNLEEKVVFASFFEKFNLKNIDPIILLYQTGYLTIKKVVQRGYREVFTIGYPNFEVRSSLLENIFEEYAYKRQSEIGETILQLEESLLGNDIPTFIQLFQVIFADISNRLLKQYLEEDNLILWEAYYHTVIYIALNLVATQSYIDCEVQTNKGYTDAIVITEKYVHIIEFKVGTAKEALEQITSKKYYQPYLQQQKEIILVGIGFNPKERNIDSWLIEEINN